MDLFGNKKNNKKLSFGFGGYVFTIDDQYVSYRSIYGKFFRVLKKDIESISLDSAGMGKNIFKINGKGTVLAQVEIPKIWAEKAQSFILNEVSTNSKENTVGINDLEKLLSLKEKGVISEEEFLLKKKQILGL